MEEWENIQCITYENTTDIPDNEVLYALMVTDPHDQEYRLGRIIDAGCVTHICSHNSKILLRKYLHCSDCHPVAIKMKMSEIRALSRKDANIGHRLTYLIDNFTASTLERKGG